MRTIHTIFDGKVFVPVEDVDLEKGVKATLEIESETERPSEEEWHPPTAEDRERFRRELQAYFDEHLPGLQVDEGLIRITGIAPPMTDEEIKEMYYMHFLETDE
ncbi:MAG: hypothetical protein JW941_03290 [Candidatus Coatesbacteria bacterium]|nr:hypothetical protein [Candidatus Coatesbacteria bacterium]